VPVSVIFGLHVFVFLILAPSTKLVAALQRAPGHSHCDLGAFAGIFIRHMEFNLYAKIG